MYSSGSLPFQLPLLNSVPGIKPPEVATIRDPRARQHTAASSLTAVWLHVLQAPDRKAVKTDLAARQRGSQEEEKEEEEVECGPEVRRWRTGDGECNNLHQPHWGRSHSAYVRLVSPLYSDSSLAFRLSSDGSELPSARAVSDRLAGRGVGGGGGSGLSGHSMQWGQFLTHDMDHTPEQAPPHVTDCCGEDGDHPACAPITIPPTDSLYSLHNKTCINFLRSSLASTSACMVDQQNQVTSYLDGSMVYGSNLEATLELREMQGGRLRVSQGKL